jgi:hypothetical protein
VTNRKERRAQRSARGQLKALKGGKPVPPSTPAQRLGEDLLAFLDDYTKRKSGLEAMDVTKVVMQVSASMAQDFGAQREEFLHACGHVFDEEEKARAERRKY